MAKELINNGANVNLISDAGRSALTEAVLCQNTTLLLKLLSRGAEIFYEPINLRDKSPFFQAVDQNQNWAIVLFCDHGADLTVRDSMGLPPIIRATKRKMFDISLYLALRVGNSLNTDVDANGQNTFVIYLLRKDYNRCRQLIIRGAKIDY